MLFRILFLIILYESSNDQAPLKSRVILDQLHRHRHCLVPPGTGSLKKPLKAWYMNSSTHLDWLDG